MTEAVDGGRPQDAIREGVRPFRDIQVGGDDGAPALVAFRDHLMKILILDSRQWFETKVVDDQKIGTDEFGKLSFEAVGGPGGVDLGEHPGCVGKQNVIAFTDGTMAEGPGDVAFTLIKMVRNSPYVTFR